MFLHSDIFLSFPISLLRTIMAVIVGYNILLSDNDDYAQVQSVNRQIYIKHTS